MHKIKDERLIIRNLKNIRIIFAIQNASMVLILIYQLFKSADSTAVLSLDNPISVVFLVGGITGAVLSVNVSQPMADNAKLSGFKIGLIAVLSGLAAALFFCFALAFNYLWIAVASGLLIAALIGGLLLYSNRFRN